MPASLLLSWREGVTAGPGEGGALRVGRGGGEVVLGGLPGSAAAGLLNLAPEGGGEERLADRVVDADGAEGLARWYFALQRLARLGWVTRSVADGAGRVLTLVPVGPSFALGPVAPADPDRPRCLSRFAYLRREGDRLVVESPLAHARVVLEDHRGVALAGALAAPVASRDLAGRVPGLDPDAAALAVGLLDSARLLDPGGGEPDALRAWEFHDLLFHARSRKGRSDAPFGASYRMAGLTDPPPAIAPAGDGPAVALERPNLARLEQDDPPLARVIEQRRSVRDYGDPPLSARQLGEFLYRVARVTGVHAAEVETPRGPVRMEFAPRPYPSGGGLYELEFYPVVRRCDGLGPGLYRYDPLGHRLVTVRGDTPEVRRLAADAAVSAGIEAGSVQVVMVLAARVPRLGWKYSSIAYALVLKHVGVVYEAMYLAAIAMGLAPCALGGGDSDLFARASGADYLAETSVGEFLLGSRPRQL